MLYQTRVLAIALAVTFSAAPAVAQPSTNQESTNSTRMFDYGKYPDLQGQWVRYGPSGPDLTGPLVRSGPTGKFRTRFDPSKPPGMRSWSVSSIKTSVKRIGR